MSMPGTSMGKDGSKIITKAPEIVYLIKIPFDEQKIIKGILSSRNDKTSLSLCKRIAMNVPSWAISTFENGFMMGVLSSQRNAVPECWKQLIDIMNQIKKDAGVEVTDLGDNMLQLKDNSGFTIVRQKYEWE